MGLGLYGLPGCFGEIDKWIWGKDYGMWVKLGFRVGCIPCSNVPGFDVKVLCFEHIMGLNLLM